MDKVASVFRTGRTSDGKDETGRHDIVCAIGEMPSNHSDWQEHPCHCLFCSPGDVLVMSPA